MILILGWPPISKYEPPMRHGLVKLYPALCEEQPITSCLAALPRHREERRWLLSFLNTIRSVGTSRICVMTSTSKVSRLDFHDCEAAGIEEIVLMQDSTMSTEAIEVIGRCQGNNGDNRTGIRIWLQQSAAGHYEHNICAWRHRIPSVFSIELVPFPYQQIAASSDYPSRASTTPLACQWLQSVLTVSNSGAIVPCPAQSPYNAPFLDQNTNSEILNRHKRMRDSLSLNPICHSCHRPARFMIPALLNEPDQSKRAIRTPISVNPYRDHVKHDAGTSPSDKLDSLLAEFISRVMVSKSESER